MMRFRIALLTFVLVGVCVPLLATGTPCVEEEEEGIESCDVDCALCLCCSHAPQAAHTAVVSGSTGSGTDDVGTWDGARPPTPPPQDILHVPRPARCR